MLAELYPGEEVTSMNDRHGDIMSEAGGAVWVEDSLNVGRIFNGRLTYNKGAAIVHTLRFLINDDAIFFEVLQTYQTTYGGGTASATDFKTVAEAVTGMDFTAFFDEWYYGEGFPTYSIEFMQVGGELIVLLNQNVSMPGVTPFFTNDLEIRIQKTGGLFEFVRLTGIESGSQYFSLPIEEGTVVNISVDPKNWIINQFGGTTQNLNLSELTENTIELDLYPNPANDQLILNNTSSANAYVICDLTGRVVLNGTLVEGKNTIAITNLESGQYVISANGGQKVFTKI